MKDNAVTAKHRYHGGLQFDGDPEGAIERVGSIVATTLEDYGHLVERKTMLSKYEASIVCSQYLVQLTLETDIPDGDDRYERMDRAAGLKTMVRPAVSKPRNRLVISISPVSALLDDSEVSELMLVVILYRMVDICSTQRVEWLSPNTVLTISQFMSAFDTLTPSAPRSRRQIFQSVAGPFVGVNTADDAEADLQADDVSKPRGRPIQLSDEQLLSIAFRTVPDEEATAAPADADPDTPERPSDLLRLTTWGITGAVAVLSTPAALSMAAVNLIRGEDFRLNTQVLAYTVAIVGLNTSGAIADAATALGM